MNLTTWFTLPNTSLLWLMQIPHPLSPSRKLCDLRKHKLRWFLWKSPMIDLSSKLGVWCGTGPQYWDTHSGTMLFHIMISYCSNEATEQLSSLWWPKSGHCAEVCPRIWISQPDAVKMSLIFTLKTSPLPCTDCPSFPLQNEVQKTLQDDISITVLCNNSNHVKTCFIKTLVKPFVWLVISWKTHREETEVR